MSTKPINILFICFSLFILHTSCTNNLQTAPVRMSLNKILRVHGITQVLYGCCTGVARSIAGRRLYSTSAKTRRRLSRDEDEKHARASTSSAHIPPPTTFTRFNCKTFDGQLLCRLCAAGVGTGVAVIFWKSVCALCSK